MAMLPIRKTLSVSYDEALAKLPARLQAEGFGVLTEIDVSATLKAKLGVDFRRYKILGACNPTLAHEALQLNPAVGVVMPCNVVVQENDDKTATVTAVDPAATLATLADPRLDDLGRRVREKLARIVEGL